VRDVPAGRGVACARECVGRVQGLDLPSVCLVPLHAGRGATEHLQRAWCATPYSSSGASGAAHPLFGPACWLCPHNHPRSRPHKIAPTNFRRLQAHGVHPAQGAGQALAQQEARQGQRRCTCLQFVACWGRSRTGVVCQGARWPVLACAARALLPQW
jgi:hypothetical protein